MAGSSLSTTDALGVIGARGHAKVLIAAARAAGFDVGAAFDDDPALAGGAVLGVPVRGVVSAAAGWPGPLVVAIGDNAIRKRLVLALGARRWASVVHPRAWVHESVRIGAGSVVFAGAIVQPDAVLGDHAIVNTAASVDHDCRIGDFGHVGPGAHLSGSTILEDGAFLGTGSATRQGVRIGAWTTVGVGGVVVRDLPPGVVAVGVPARPR
jgi:sugar O-acyltransferase (sialic acid O-acetyltransferase NeuD family)